MKARSENAEALKSAKRASARSAAVVHGELKRGLNSLATIASTAQWVGLFGTILGIHNSFGGVTGSKTSIMAYYFDGLSRAFVPCVIGLVVALIAKWVYKFLHRGRSFRPVNGKRIAAIDKRSWPAWVGVRVG